MNPAPKIVRTAVCALALGLAVAPAWAAPGGSLTRTKDIIHLRYAKAQDMSVMLQIMLPDITVYALEELNALEIYDDPALIAEAKSLVELSDLPKRQVVVELEAFEMSRTRSLNFGLDVQDGQVDLKAILPPEVLREERLGLIFPGKVHFQDRKSDIRILANPKIMITNRQEARIHIGDRIPYEVASLGQGGQAIYTVQFVDVGIKATVRPTIYGNDEIDLDIEAEVSSVGKLTPRGYPEIGTRTTKTTIHIKDGATAILGGLLKEETRRARTGVPILNRIPLLGLLFGHTVNEKIMTEVRISISPKIIHEVAAETPAP